MSESIEKIIELCTFLFWILLFLSKIFLNIDLIMRLIESLFGIHLPLKPQEAFLKYLGLLNYSQSENIAYITNLTLGLWIITSVTPRLFHIIRFRRDTFEVPYHTSTGTVVHYLTRWRDPESGEFTTLNTILGSICTLFIFVISTLFIYFINWDILLPSLGVVIYNFSRQAFSVIAIFFHWPVWIGDFLNIITPIIILGVKWFFHGD